VVKLPKIIGEADAFVICSTLYSVLATYLSHFVGQIAMRRPRETGGKLADALTLYRNKSTLRAIIPDGFD